MINLPLTGKIICAGQNKIIMDRLHLKCVKGAMSIKYKLLVKRKWFKYWFKRIILYVAFYSTFVRCNYFLHSLEWKPLRIISKICYNSIAGKNSTNIVIPWDLHISYLSPIRTPGVLNDPVFYAILFSITHQYDWVLCFLICNVNRKKVFSGSADMRIHSLFNVQ